MNNNEWVRSFGSKREAQDMQKVLSRHNFGPKENFLVKKSDFGLFDLEYIDRLNRNKLDNRVGSMQNFLRGWISCTNTKRLRPKVR